MFKIFRKIRFDLLKENKIVRYIFYAIGEIILVIIGILLALNINNKNELRKQEEKVVNILKQIHHELEISIIDLDEAIEFYRQKDSLIYLVLNDMVTFDDYMDPGNGKLHSIMTYWIDSYIPSNGYNTLMINIDNIPEKYTPLLANLNKIYIDDIEELNRHYNNIGELVKGTMTNLMNSKNWFSGSFYKGANRAELSLYFLTDSLYFNRVSFMSLIINNNFLKQALDIRTDMIKSYKEITEILGLEDEVQRTKPTFLYNPNNYVKYIGKYLNDEYSREIRIDGNQLIYVKNDEDSLQIYPFSSTIFYVESLPNFYSVQLDENGKTISITIKSGPQTDILYKVK